MKMIFDVIQDKLRTPLIQAKIKKGPAGFRTKWGLYGTSEWLQNLRNDGLTEVIKGTIIEIIYTGHNDFPEFVMLSESKRYQFERLGNASGYQVGKNIKVEVTKSMNIQPMSGLENSLAPLIIEIEE